MDLTAEELRVLGCLVEKELATPQHYPLTENALMSACNQSTNRDPVVDYDRDTVRRALVELRRRGLAREVHRPGERAAKHRHLAADALELEAGELALLAVLVLRGPQTPGELRTRAERLHHFSGTLEIHQVLERMRERGLAVRLERYPGQKEARFAHLLGDDEPTVTPPAPRAAPPPRGAGSSVDDRLAQLEAEVARLSEAVAELRSALGG